MRATVKLTCTQVVPLVKCVTPSETRMREFSEITSGTHLQQANIYNRRTSTTGEHLQQANMEVCTFTTRKSSRFYRVNLFEELLNFTCVTLAVWGHPAKRVPIGPFMWSDFDIWSGVLNAFSDPLYLKSAFLQTMDKVNRISCLKVGVLACQGYDNVKATLLPNRLHNFLSLDRQDVERGQP